MHHVVVPTVTIGHSAAFTWDGKVTIFGHEPGGGVAAECEATDDPFKKSFFFYDTETGAFLGLWTLPRPQGPTENCTLHNYNMVPLRNGRDLLVSGNYQAGTWVVDLTDPANAQTVAWSDPAAEAGPARNAVLLRRHGSLVDLLVRRRDLRVEHRRGAEHLQAQGQGDTQRDQAAPPEPQTQEFSLDGRRGDDDEDDDD